MGNPELRKKADALAYKYEKEYGGCPQCVLAAVKETVGGISDDVFKAATGFAGGVAVVGTGTCGALSGGVMALSAHLGREYANFADPQRIRWETFRICKKLVNKFETEFGGGLCKDVQTRIMGRSYNLWDDQDYKDFNAAGGHDDKCTMVCGKAARWVIEILEEDKLI